MIYTYFLLLLLNPSLSMSLLFKKKIEEAIPIIIIAMTLILFISGVMINLEVGYYSILFINLLLLFYNSFQIFKRKISLKSILLSPGFLIFILVYIYFIYLSMNRMSIQWDEFSHWALNAKNLFFTNHFGIGKNSVIMFQTYLSGTSILQYFVLKLNGEFLESLLYFTINISLFSMILPVFRIFQNLKTISIYLLLPIVILIPTFFYPTYYSSLYIDAALSIAFAYTLYSYFSNRDSKLSLFNYLSIIAGHMMLIFLKDFGTVLSLIAWVIILTDNACIKNKFKINTFIKNNYILILTIIPSFLILLIWNITLSINDVVNRKSSFGPLLSTLFNFLGFESGTYQRTVIHNFSEALIKRNLTDTTVTISYIVIIFIVIVVGYLLFIKAKNNEDKQSITFVIIWLIFGALGYALLLLISYLALFSEYEAVRLASFERYISTYALGTIMFILYMFVNKYNDSRQGLIKNMLTLLMLILIFINKGTIYDLTIGAMASSNNSKESRTIYIEAEDYIKQHASSDDRIYFLSIYDKGYDYYLMKYHLFPITVNPTWQWSIGEPYSDEDIWTTNIKLEDWIENLKNYDYLYIHQISDNFIDMYGSVFEEPDEISSRSLYEIIIRDELFLRKVN